MFEKEGKTPQKRSNFWWSDTSQKKVRVDSGMIPNLVMNQNINSFEICAQFLNKKDFEINKINSLFQSDVFQDNFLEWILKKEKNEMVNFFYFLFFNF